MPEDTTGEGSGEDVAPKGLTDSVWEARQRARLGAPAASSDAPAGPPPAAPAAAAPLTEAGAATRADPTAPMDRPRERTAPIAPVTPPEHPPPRRRPLPLGRIVLGGLLLLGGLLWLLGVLDVLDVSLRAVLSLSLVAVGVGLFVGARTGGHGGLMLLGVLLTALLTFLSSFDIQLEGGVGNRTERPLTAQGLPESYRLGVGQLTVDLTELELPAGETRIQAIVGIGRLVVRIPPDMAVRVRGNAGGGQVEVFGSDGNGFDVDRTARRNNPGSASARVVVVAEVGLGQVVIGVRE